jgi:PHP family Zn ribbon phosphoesterase
MILDEIKNLPTEYMAKRYDALDSTYEVEVIKLSDIEKILGEKCNWKYGEDSDNGYYDTSCENSFQFFYDKLEDNIGFKHCPYCGKEIQEVKDEN